ncbi:hypothetical protein AN958_00104, partial [Leucoagaricus sp. SymC.cos]
WLEKRGPTMEYLNKILAITHPRLYDQGLVALSALEQLNDTNHYATRWKSVFTGVTIVSNRITPPHRDNKGHIPWYDQLVCIGDYESADFHLPELGATFKYLPGTVVHFCGNLLVHQVNSWQGNDRICYASFFRKSVFDRLSLICPGWSTIDEYLSREQRQMLERKLGR